MAFMRRNRDEKLKAFKEYATGLVGMSRANLRNELEWWALGRHHGLVTPLLDWSQSPYIAAFFAWSDYFLKRNPGLAEWGATSMTVGDGSITVWELVITDDLSQDGEFVVFNALADNAYRQKAQLGVFTFLDHHTYFDIESYLRARGLAYKLTRYNILGIDATTAMADLDLMNVRYASLFPDLDGAARQANIDARAFVFREVGALVARKQAGKIS